MADTIIQCGIQVKRRWPSLGAQWVLMYPQLFDADDIRSTRTQPKNHCAEWFAAIHLFHRDGVLSLIEKYIYKTHPTKVQRVVQVGGDRLLETLREIRREMCVRPPDLLLYSQHSGLQGFAEVKGPGDRREQSFRQRESHWEIERRLGVGVEVIEVCLTDGAQGFLTRRLRRPPAVSDILSDIAPAEFENRRERTQSYEGIRNPQIADQAPVTVKPADFVGLS